MIKIGIIGYGYWGPNLVRNFSLQQNCKVHGVADSRDERLNNLSRNYPEIKTFKNGMDLIDDPEVDAVVIATPVFTHHQLAKRALNAGKHVLVEKPMTASVEEALELINIAERAGLTLMVDHTFLYTGAVRKMKEIIDGGIIGTPKYFDSSRINLGLFQPDINVLWDLAPHDISILSFLVHEIPHSVNASGISHTHNGIENIGYMTVNYNSDFIAHFNCSWTSPVKVRQTLIGGDKKMIVYNDLEPSEKVRIYDTGYHHKNEEENTRIMVDYRTGDIHIPKLDSTEALFEVAKDFLKAIEQKTVPIANSTLGLNVVQMLAAAQQSIKNNGQLVTIN